jgi:hypothetical protein
MRRGRVLSAVCVAAATAALSAAPPTFGHFTDIFHGNDHGTNDHSHYDLWDNECDGNRVYGNAYDASGYRGPAYDPDGCGGIGRHLDGLQFTSYRLCEEGVSCTQFYPT